MISTADIPPISLAELLVDSALQQRLERKYIVDVATLSELLARVRDTHRVLDIEGRRVFHYRTTYYDTPELVTLRAHLQQRRRRFKLRRRHYVESRTSVLEVKLKGARGMVIKRALPTVDRVDLLAHESAFFRTAVLEAYGHDLPVAALGPVLTMSCARLTLAARGGAERLTCDVEVDLDGARLVPDHAIVESKSLRGVAIADRVLRDLGARPADRCSKYCLGVAFARPDIHANDFARVLRYFEPVPGRAKPDHPLSAQEARHDA